MTKEQEGCLQEIAKAADEAMRHTRLALAFIQDKDGILNVKSAWADAHWIKRQAERALCSVEQPIPMRPSVEL